MLTRIPIRSKLALALVLPVLAVFAVSIYEVTEASGQVDKVQKDTDLASVALGPGSLIAALQNERNDTATTVVGLRDALNLETKDLAASQRATDVAATSFRAALKRSGPDAERVYASSLAELDASLAALRQRTAEFKGEANFDQLPLSNQQWDGYTATIDRFQAANSRLGLLVEDPQLRSAVEMLDLVSRQTESIAVMVRTGAISSLGGADVEGTTKTDVLAGINQFQADLKRFDLLATGPYAELARNQDQNPSYDVTIGLLQDYIDTDKLDPTELINAAGDTGGEGVTNTAALTEKTAGALEDRSAQLLDDAEARQRNFIALALLVLVAGGAFMIVAARSITRPLLSLTKQADQMAAERLPSAVQQILDTPLGEDVVIPDVTPVRVKTRDEVQDVAVALNSVQSSALDLAVEQAVLRRNISDSFVNLGRRTQNLIGRQLDFITELERNETDPATLTNLFKLDHLATRARRNAESLVVLAGLVTPRTWGAPIAMGDVIRAALGEVEDYQRVEVRPIGDALVPGATASDLVHLLAELLENGLSFSPPGRPVEVHGRMTKNGYVLAVIDQGIGMTKDELASANERLAGRESYTIAPSRYLGHYVAGNLAQRIGVDVTLSESPTGGVSAKIVIPNAVLDAVPAMPGLAPPAQAELAADTSTADRDPVVIPDRPASNDIWDDDEATPAAANGAVPATARDGAVPTTEHGLRRRVRRPEPAADPSTNGHRAGGPVPSEPSPVAAPAAPAPAPAAEVAPPAAPPAPVRPVAPAPSAAPQAPAPQAPAPQAPAPVATAPSGPPAAAPAAPQQVAPAPSTGPAPTPRPAAPMAPAPVASAPAAPAPVAPVAPAPVASAPTAPAPVASAAPAAPPAKTANGLRKRVPGDQLAASSLSPMIPRGKAAAPVDDAPLAGRASADSMFSLLSTFESGVQRGRTDLTRTSGTDAPGPDTDREV